MTPKAPAAPREAPAPRTPPEARTPPETRAEPKGPAPDVKAERSINKLEARLNNLQNQKGAKPSNSAPAPAPAQPTVIATPVLQVPTKLSQLNKPQRYIRELEPYDFSAHYHEVVEKGKRVKEGSPKDLGNVAVNESAREHAAGKDNEARINLDYANIMFDLGLSIFPLTSFPKDVYEFTTGVGFISGEPLSDEARILCFVGIASLGAADLGRAGLKVAMIAGAAHLAPGTTMAFLRSVNAVTHSFNSLGIKSAIGYEKLTSLVGDAISKREATTQTLTVSQTIIHMGEGKWMPVFEHAIDPKAIVGHPELVGKLKVDLGIAESWVAKETKTGRESLFSRWETQTIT
jgi:hypothetical protein